MIEFCGNLQGQARKYAFKQVNKHSIIGSIIAAVLATIAIILLAVFVDVIILVFLVLPPTLILVSIFAKSSKSIEASIFPERIVVDKDCIISSSAEFRDERELSQINSIIDFGEFYQIIFDAKYESNKYICQKDLITKGTIEDFEKLFENKIVRKYKSK